MVQFRSLFQSVSLTSRRRVGGWLSTRQWGCQLGGGEGDLSWATMAALCMQVADRQAAGLQHGLLPKVLQRASNLISFAFMSLH
jgi:hypothetical protein